MLGSQCRDPINVAQIPAGPEARSLISSDVTGYRILWFCHSERQAPE